MHLSPIKSALQSQIPSASQFDEVDPELLHSHAKTRTTGFMKK